jgi:chaperonin GroEL (HSP60 family)
VIRMVRVFCPEPILTSSNCETVIAAQSIANIVKSSLGPLGLDKMLVDNIGVSAINSYSVYVV